MSTAKESKMQENVIVRNIEEEDLREVAALSYRCFGPDMSLSYENMQSQFEIFPEGQVLAEYESKIIGCALSLIVNFDEYGDDHSYEEISGNGYIRNHNPDGVNLYGIEVGVDPDYRQLKIGKKLYEARKKICREHNLKSIMIGGRMPHYYKYAEVMTAEEYVAKVMVGDIYDPVMTFQKKNGFKLRKIMPNYLEGDEESLYNASSMEWINDQYEER